MTRGPVVGITLGDTGGVGPEVAIKAVHSRQRPAGLRMILIGSQAAVQRDCTALGYPMPPLLDVPDTLPADELRRRFRTAPRIALWDPPVRGRATRLPHRRGTVTVAAARSAHAWIVAAARACATQALDAMVTAPINKEGFARAGIQTTGHTELLAETVDAKQVGMMLLGGGLRVVIVTRHTPLADVPALITRRTVTEAIRMTHAATGWLKAAAAPIAVCGLNPHAGDGGTIGHEDREVILPCIRALQREGLPLAGPLPADTVFHQALEGRFSAVVAMYHDQGLGPLKTVAFDSGVNLTLGLPIVRTSPDHGTAYDRAGTGDASATSMLAALDLAVRLSGRPTPWGAS